MNKELYATWTQMKARCYNPNATGYDNYGGRGITVCEEWLNSYETFANDMGERPKGCTLDRIDNNKNYCKENCKWSTAIEQASNRRNSQPIEYNGNVYKTHSELARKLNINKDVLNMRLKRGMTLEEAINKPVDKGTLISYNNEIHNIKTWAEIINIPASVIADRLRLHWDIKKILTTPVKSIVPNQKIIEYKGKNYSISSLAKTINVERHKLSKLLKEGLTIKEIKEKTMKDLLTKLNLQDKEIETFCEFIKKYKQNNYIFLNVLKNKTKIKTESLQKILEVMVKQNILKKKLSLICPNCMTTNGYYDSIEEIANEYTCLHCDEEFEPKQDYIETVWQVKEPLD